MNNVEYGKCVPKTVIPTSLQSNLDNDNCTNAERRPVRADGEPRRRTSSRRRAPARASSAAATPASACRSASVRLHPAARHLAGRLRQRAQVRALHQPAHRPAHGRAGVPARKSAMRRGEQSSARDAARGHASRCMRAGSRSPTTAPRRSAAAARSPPRPTTRRRSSTTSPGWRGSAARACSSTATWCFDATSSSAPASIPTIAVGGDAVGRAAVSQGAQHRRAVLRAVRRRCRPTSGSTAGPSRSACSGRRRSAIAPTRSSVGGVPAPARYDLVQALPLVVFPTLAAAVRATVARHRPRAARRGRASSISTSVSFTDIGKGAVPQRRVPAVRLDQPAARRRARPPPRRSALMFRPLRWWSPSAPTCAGRSTSTPSGTVARRRRRRRCDARSIPAPATLLDATCRGWCASARASSSCRTTTSRSPTSSSTRTWESWSAAQGDGPQVQHPDAVAVPGHPPDDRRTTTTTPSRCALGGALQHRAAERACCRLRARRLLRLVGDRRRKDTRLDFDTLAKIGGDRSGSATRCTASPSTSRTRTCTSSIAIVTDGDIRPINGAAARRSRSTIRAIRCRR